MKISGYDYNASTVATTALRISTRIPRTIRIRITAGARVLRESILRIIAVTAAITRLDSLKRVVFCQSFWAVNT